MEGKNLEKRVGSNPQNPKLLAQIAETIGNGYHTKLGAFLTWSYILSSLGVAYGTEYSNVADVKNLSGIFATSIPIMLYGLYTLGLWKQCRSTDKKR